MEKKVRTCKKNAKLLKGERGGWYYLSKDNKKIYCKLSEEDEKHFKTHERKLQEQKNEKRRELLLKEQEVDYSLKKIKAPEQLSSSESEFVKKIAPTLIKNIKKYIFDNVKNAVTFYVSPFLEFLQFLNEHEYKQKISHEQMNSYILRPIDFILKPNDPLIDGKLNLREFLAKETLRINEEINKMVQRNSKGKPGTWEYDPDTLELVFFENPRSKKGKWTSIIKKNINSDNSDNSDNDINDNDKEYEEEFVFVENAQPDDEWFKTRDVLKNFVKKSGLPWQELIHYQILQEHTFKENKVILKEHERTSAPFIALITLAKIINLLSLNKPIAARKLLVDFRLKLSNYYLYWRKQKKFAQLKLERKLENEKLVLREKEQEKLEKSKPGKEKFTKADSDPDIDILN